MVRARMPARAAASTWLRMSASRGETITVGPLPVVSETRRASTESAEALRSAGSATSALVMPPCNPMPPTLRE